MSKYLTFLIFNTFAYSLGILPLKISRKIAANLASFFYYFVPIRKKVVLKNLGIAFPKKTNAEIRSIAHKHYRSVMITMVEIFRMARISESELRGMIKAESLDIVRETTKKGKGLFLLSAHFANWELGAVAMGVFTGNGIHMLAKTQSNRHINIWMNEMRTRFGNEIIQVGPSVREIFKAISAGHIVGMVGDQRGSREGMRVKFFGRETAVYPGTASIAQKTGAPIITYWIAREADGVYSLRAEPFETEGKTVEEINQEYMYRLEKLICQYPEQWFWLHNIWKY